MTISELENDLNLTEALTLANLDLGPEMRAVLHGTIDSWEYLEPHRLDPITNTLRTILDSNPEDTLTEAAHLHTTCTTLFTTNPDLHPIAAGYANHAFNSLARICTHHTDLAAAWWLAARTIINNARPTTTH